MEASIHFREKKGAPSGTHGALGRNDVVFPRGYLVLARREGVIAMGAGGQTAVSVHVRV